jgi:hypothetical protein
MTVLLGLLLAMPVLWSGLLGDDYIHWSLINHPSADHAKAWSFYGLFSFIEPTPGNVASLKQVGMIPWWTSDHAHLTFWRPLAELSHALDYTLWPRSPFLMHLHNLLWYGLMIGLLAKLYRELSPEVEPAHLGVLLFALSGLHAFVFGWIAARNQMITGCLGIITILAFHHWRQERSALHAALALATTVLGLLSAEGAVATVGYLVAYSITLDKSPWRQRLWSLLPFLIIVVVWRAVYTHLGYGTMGSAGYIDPGADPAGFIKELLIRAPALLAAYLYGITSAILMYLPRTTQILYALGATLAVLAAAWVGHYFKLWAMPLARFYALGAVAALVPVSASQANDRLLIHAEIGLSGLLALLFCQAAKHRQVLGQVATWPPRIMIWVLGFVHFVYFPILLVGSCVVIIGMTKAMPLEEALALPDAGTNAPARYVLLHAPTPMLTSYYPYMRRYFGMNNAASTLTLAKGGNQALSFEVQDASTLLVRSPQGFIDWMSRDIEKEPFRVGQVVDLGHTRITIMAVTDNGTPTAASFWFNKPLTDPSWQFFAWDAGKAAYAPYTLPAPGQTFTLPPISLSELSSRRVKAGLPW